MDTPTASETKAIDAGEKPFPGFHRHWVRLKLCTLWTKLTE